MTVDSACRLPPARSSLPVYKGLANGEKHAELAHRLGYSGRHFQRLLAELWEQLGVDNTVEGVVDTAVQGWITVTRDIA